MVFVSIVKNWNSAPRARIAPVSFPNAANASAVRQPRTPAVAINGRRPMRFASRAAAVHPRSEPTFMIIVYSRLCETEYPRSTSSVGMRKFSVTCTPKAIHDATPMAIVRRRTSRWNTAAGEACKDTGGRSAGLSRTGPTASAGGVKVFEARTASERFASSIRPFERSQRGVSGNLRRYRTTNSAGSARITKLQRQTWSSPPSGTANGPRRSRKRP